MERSTRGLRESTHYYCATALRLVEVDGEHLGSHLWRGASLLAKWLGAFSAQYADTVALWFLVCTVRCGMPNSLDGAPCCVRITIHSKCLPSDCVSVPVSLCECLIAANVSLYMSVCCPLCMHHAVAVRDPLSVLH